jgi:hypothetical protein
MGTTGGEGFASALLRLLFQDGKEDMDIRNDDTHESNSLCKSSKNKSH